MRFHRPRRLHAPPTGADEPQGRVGMLRQEIEARRQDVLGSFDLTQATQADYVRRGGWSEARPRHGGYGRLTDPHPGRLDLEPLHHDISHRPARDNHRVGHAIGLLFQDADNGLVLSLDFHVLGDQMNWSMHANRDGSCSQVQRVAAHERPIAQAVEVVKLDQIGRILQRGQCFGKHPRAGNCLMGESGLGHARSHPLHVEVRDRRLPGLAAP